MVWDTGKSSFDTGQDIWDTGKWSGILVNPVLLLVKTSGILVSGLVILVNPVFDTGQEWVLDTGKSSFDTGQGIWDTGKWSVILVNPVLILVKTSGILVSGLGYW